jgi:hypothetical protein
VIVQKYSGKEVDFITLGKLIISMPSLIKPIV